MCVCVCMNIWWESSPTKRPLRAVHWWLYSPDKGPVTTLLHPSQHRLRMLLDSCPKLCPAPSKGPSKILANLFPGELFLLAIQLWSGSDLDTSANDGAIQQDSFNHMFSNEVWTPFLGRRTLLCLSSFGCFRSALGHPLYFSYNFTVVVFPS